MGDLTDADVRAVLEHLTRACRALQHEASLHNYPIADDGGWDQVGMPWNQHLLHDESAIGEARDEINAADILLGIDTVAPTPEGIPERG